MHARSDVPPERMLPIEEADLAAAQALARHRRHPAVRAVGEASEIADQPPLLALAAGAAVLGLALGDRRLARAGARAFAAVLVATGLKTVVKNSVTRTRPGRVLEGAPYERHAPGGEGGPLQSFPSGHTAGAVAAVRAVARVYPEHRAPAYAAAALVGAAQVPRGAHYPLDVAAGTLVGLAAEAIVDRVWPDGLG